jgi:hypothetical protein
MVKGQIEIWLEAPKMIGLALVKVPPFFTLDNVFLQNNLKDSYLTYIESHGSLNHLKMASIYKSYD